MKVSVQKNILQSALHQLVKATPTRSTIPILNCVLFSAKDNTLLLRTTDLELTMLTSFPINMDSSGSVAIPHRTLLDITNAMPDTEMTFLVDEENKINIQTEFGNYDIAGVSADEFPSLPEVDNKKEITLKSDILSRLISKTVFALSGDELKPALLGTLFEFSEAGVTSVATDGHRLAICSRTDYEPNSFAGDVIVPKKFLMLLLQYLDNDEKDIVLWIGDNHITVSLGNITIFSRIIDDRYPDYRSVIPQENDRIAKCNREKLIASVKRVSIFSNRSTKQIAIHFSKKESIITTEDPESASSAKEKIEIEYGDEDLIVGYNAIYLNEVLSHIDTENILFKLKTSISAGLVLPEIQQENEELTMLLMPMRMND